MSAQISSRQKQIEITALAKFETDLRRAVDQGLVSAGQADPGLRWIRQAQQANSQIVACLEARSIWSWFCNSARMLATRDFVAANRRFRTLIALHSLAALVTRRLVQDHAGPVGRRK
jgi:hypothetical protein